MSRAAEGWPYRAMIDSDPYGVLLIDDAGNVAYANPAAAALLASDATALAGRSLVSLLSRGNDPDWDGLDEVLVGESAPLGSLDLLGAEGTIITVEATLTGVRHDGAAMTVLRLRDIREDLQASRVMDERERFLAGIFQNAGVGIAVTDTDGTIRDANTTFREYVGRDLEGLVGRPFAELLADDEREEGGRILQALGRGALNGFVTEHRYVRDSGAESWGETRSAALRDAEGRVERVIVAITDLTARRRANATFRAVFEHSDDGYLILRRNRVDDANRAALALFGVDAPTDLPMPLFGGDQATTRVVSSGASGADATEVLAAAWAGVTQRSEWEIQRSDGTTATVGLTLVPIQIGQDEALLAVLHDHTQQKLFEAQLVEARDAAESAARAKADFLATMSHEIRTPMNGVIGMVDLLAESALTADQQRMIRTTKDSAFALLAIINDVLDFSKIEAGKLVLEAVPVGVHELGDAVIEMLGTNAASAGLSLQATVDPEVPEAIVGDPVRLRQILFNLVGNAIKFTSAGGVLVHSSIVAAGSDRRFRISVRDTGIGMTQDQIDRLFQPFTQAESSTTRRFGGTGLGLSIVSRIVALMGGEMSIDSRPEVGSSFHVDLPLLTAAWVPDLPDLSGLRIADLSDGSPEHEVVVRTLSRAGVEVQALRPSQLQERLRSGSSLPDVAYLGSAMDPIERVRIRGLADTAPGATTMGFVAGVGAGAAMDAPDLPDTVLVAAAPLTRADLFRAIAVASGRASPMTASLGDTSAPVTREAARDAKQLLLVAEDNATNQEVIRRQLQLLGYWADIVSDGRQALAALEQESYAALLTDCHMPHLDGFELTAAIRSGEIETSDHLPIIAITANALQGEGARCLAEGMDDYLTKPIAMEALTESLWRWVGPSRPRDEGSSSSIVADVLPRSSALVTGPTDPDDEVILDTTILEATLRGDRATARMLLGDFVPNAQALVLRASSAVASGDAEEIVRVGHTLKSSARAVGALQLGASCERLERLAGTRPAQQMGPDVQQLALAFERMRDAVHAALVDDSEDAT